MLQAIDRAGAIPILATQRDGETTYHTQWFTTNPDKYCLDEPTPKDNLNADDEIVQEYTNTKGETYTLLNCNGTGSFETEEGYVYGPKGEDGIANVTEGTPLSWTHTGSTSGFIFPALQLINQTGLDPLTGVEAIMSQKHDNSVLAVCNGDAEVGVSWDDAREIVSPATCPAVEEMVVFALSQEIPADGIAVSPDLPDEFVQQIIDALLAYAETEEGAKVLDSVYQIDTYGPADLEAYDLVREAADKVEDAALD
jgi:phosphonate transport system substrate-binding protein